jgi:hypothetical protein
MKFVRDEDNASIAGNSDTIAQYPFIGTWITTNNSSRGIVKIIVRAKGQGLIIRAFGACSPEPCDWGETTATLFSDGPASFKGLAFSARYDFGFMATHLQAKVKKGVLVVAVFNRFSDSSGRSNYFSREFFYQVKGAAHA